MAVTLPTPVRLPSDFLYLGEGGLATTITLNATNTKVAFHFQANASANVDKVWFRTSTVTTSQSLTVGLQRINSSGQADGTFLVSATQASVASNTLYGVALTPTAITRGVNYAVVIEWTSTTGTVAFLVAQTTSIASPQDYGTSRRLYTSGAWATATMGMQIVGVDTDASNWYHPQLIMPISAGTHNSGFNSGSTPDERGNRIYLPAGNVCGIAFSSDTDEALDLVLYDDANSVVVTTSWVFNERSINSYLWNVAWLTSTAVSAGWHRVVMKPTTTTNISYYQNTYDANQMAGMSMGSNCYSTYRTNAGAWTDETNKLHSVFVLMNDFTDGAGGGGSLNPFTSVFGRGA